MSEVAYINPKMVTWARRQSGETRARIEEDLRLKAGRVLEWERGERRPTFNQAIALANYCGIPHGYLWLSNPPR